MQILKKILLACSIAIAVSPLYSRAEDTEAQAAARAALQEKMRELKGGAPAAETPPATKKPAEAPPVQPKKAAPQPTVPAAPAAPKAPATFEAPGAASPDLIEQARQATRARMAELQAQKQTAIPVGKEAPAPQPVFQPMTEAAPATTVVTPAMSETPAVTTEVKSAAPTAAELRAAKAREAADKKAEQARAKAQADTDEKARAAADKAAKAAKKAKPDAFAAVPLAPLEGPVSSLPTTKEQSLSALLEQYKADKISAEEYHQQRAKILAEP